MALKTALLAQRNEVETLKYREGPVNYPEVLILEMCLMLHIAAQ